MPFRSYRRRLALGFAGAIVLLALLGWLVFALIPDLFAPTKGLSLEAQAKARNDVRTAALQLLGGTVLALGAYFTWQNVLTNREGRRIEREGQITERFTRAIDQLGNKELDVRLGGIYGLERTARDSQDDHGPVMEVLTAYVREHAPWSPSSEEPEPSEGEAAANTPRATEDPSRRPTTPTTDVQAALTVIGRRELDHGKYAYRHLDLALTDLRGAKLEGANLEWADLGGANLGGANLEWANLGWADLEGANLEGANLGWANLEGAKLGGADLGGAKLGGARYNSETTRPEGFDLDAAGASKIE